VSQELQQEVASENTWVRTSEPTAKFVQLHPYFAPSKLSEQINEVLAAGEHLITPMTRQHKPGSMETNSFMKNRVCIPSCS
jgi:hypothetical protein